MTARPDRVLAVRPDELPAAWPAQVSALRSPLVQRAW
jgi:hypothetical protein